MFIIENMFIINTKIKEDKKFQRQNVTHSIITTYTHNAMLQHSNIALYVSICILYQHSGNGFKNSSVAGENIDSPSNLNCFWWWSCPNSSGHLNTSNPVGVNNGISYKNLLSFKSLTTSSLTGGSTSIKRCWLCCFTFDMLLLPVSFCTNAMKSCGCVCITFGLCVYMITGPLRWLWFLNEEVVDDDAKVAADEVAEEEEYLCMMCEFLCSWSCMGRIPLIWFNSLLVLLMMFCCCWWCLSWCWNFIGLMLKSQTQQCKRSWWISWMLFHQKLWDEHCLYEYICM